jgi:hypothetical protein
MAPCSDNSVHITDLYFQAEIAQIFGREVSKAWYHEHGIRTRSINSQPQSPAGRKSESVGRSQYDRLSFSQSGRLRSVNDLKIEPTKYSKVADNALPSEVFKLKSHAGLQFGVNFGLLYTDAAHTVLHYFDI